MTLQLAPTISRADVERIHAKSLDLLEQVGADYKTPKALQILEAHGCEVDYPSNRARIPRRLVEWALEQAPRVVRLAARDPKHDVVLDGRGSHHTTDSQGTRAIDRQTGEVRPSTLEDLIKGLLFADALDMVEIVSLMVAANDVPAHVRTVQHFASAFTHTSKHIRTSVLNAAQVPFIVDLATIAAGGDSFRPVFSTVDCTISPLMHDGAMTEACIELARLNVPIMVYPMPLAGGTSPVTLAGAILMHNTEFLSGLALFQAANPGAPIIYGTGASQLDMQTGRYGGSANGFGFGPALSALARYYHLPVNLHGLSTASPALDAQYGHEATAACLLAYLAGADEIFSIGLMGDAQILSLEKMTLDNHLARRVEQMVQSICFDDEHLAADLIARVGIGGHYLSQRETRTYTRKEYLPKWPPAGRAMMEIVRQETQEILQHHQPPALPEGAAEKMATVLDEASQALKL
ncbi:MAG: trimethylamine methyltransferase family protein [Anaerolineales bacterium]|nr:trimethylamine methyltransferase family protein [Anaerolineales bacterium]